MDPLVGQTIGGRYTLHRLIGKGAMGRVYLATDQRLHGRECAVKILAAHADEDDDERSRFERELRIVSLLRGPNVVQVLDSGTLGDGRPYIVMELLVGQSLHAHVRRRGPLPPAEAIGIAIDVLQGLAEAHAYGVVHRDLKPANVFLCPAADETLRAKVLDFGVAKQLRGDDADITRTRASVGTPRYMAPEQFVQGALSARTDLYGVGALLYVMLTARPPFSGDEEVPDAVAQLPRSSRLAWLHLHRDPLPVEGVSPALAALVARLMAKRAADRPASARAVIDALRALPEAAAIGGGEGTATLVGIGGIGGFATGVAATPARRAATRAGMGGAAFGGRAIEAEEAAPFLPVDEPTRRGDAGTDPSHDDDSVARTMGEAGTRREAEGRRRRLWIPAVAVLAGALAVLAAIGLGGPGDDAASGGPDARSAAAPVAVLPVEPDAAVTDAAITDAAVDAAPPDAAPPPRPAPPRPRPEPPRPTPKPAPPKPAPSAPAPPKPAEPTPPKPAPAGPDKILVF